MKIETYNHWTRSIKRGELYIPLLALHYDRRSVSVGLLGIGMSLIMKPNDERKALLAAKLDELRKCVKDIKDDETIDAKIRGSVVKNTELIIGELEKRLSD